MKLDKTTNVTQIEPGATPKEILKAAGLDWKVEKLPLFYKKNNNFTEVNKKYVVLKADDNQELTICNHNWQIMQNIDFVTLAYETFKDLGMTVSEVSPLNNNRAILVSAKWKNFEVGGDNSNDKVNTSLCLIGSHQCGLGHSVKLYYNRLVCTNQLVQPVRIRKAIGHSLQAKRILAESLTQAEHDLKAFKNKTEYYTQQKIEIPEAQALLIKQFGDPKKPIEDQPKIVQIVLDLYLYGRGQELQSAFNNAWGLLNGLTEYYSHSEFSKSKDRVSSIVEGSNYNSTKAFIRNLDKYLGAREQQQVKVRV